MAAPESGQVPGDICNFSGNIRNLPDCYFAAGAELLKLRVNSGEEKL
jgi:hypothetical protein